MADKYYVYMMTNNNRSVLYTGMTNDLMRRVWEHRKKLVESFTARYNLDKLVYFDELGDAPAAITREKQIKGWARKKKEALIDEANPYWLDLSEDWFGD